MPSHFAKRKKSKSPEAKIAVLLKDEPYYMSDFNASIKNCAPLTRFAYLFDLRQYMEYCLINHSEYGGIDLAHLPLSAFTSAAAQELTDWLDALSVANRVSRRRQQASSAYRNRKIAALRQFYRYLIREHLCDFDPTPLISRGQIGQTAPFVLSEKEIRKLLDGIQRNDCYLLKDPSGRWYIEPISESVRIRRERQISRNIAIISMLLYCGLTVSEAAALNLDSIDFLRSTIRCSSADGTLREIPCPLAASSALKAYLSCKDLPEELLARQTTPSQAEFLLFCRKFMLDSNAAAKACAFFGRTDEQFLLDIHECTALLRLQGRSSFSPEQSERALFLAENGHRISIRMIQHMVLEYGRTYLPELSRTRNISPEVLRNTYMFFLTASADTEIAAAQTGVAASRIKCLKKMCGQS